VLDQQQSPFSLIHQLNNSACALINQQQHQQHSRRQRSPQATPVEYSCDALASSPSPSPAQVATESFRCTLKVIKACIQAGPAGFWNDEAVHDACIEACTLADEAMHHCDGSKAFNSTSMCAFPNDKNLPLPFDLLELNSDSLELHSVYVLYNMALAARLSTTTPDAISLQLYDFALKFSQVIPDCYRRHGFRRHILLGMIDIYSSTDGYQEDVGNLLDRLLMEEIRHLVDCPAAAAVA